MKKTLSILFALALVLSFSLVAATPVAADGGWSDDFDSGPERTWIEVSSPGSTASFENDRYELYTESPAAGLEGSIASYVDQVHTDYIMQGTVQRVDPGDDFLTYLLARGTPAVGDGYVLGASSSGTHFWFGKLTGWGYSALPSVGAFDPFDPADFQFRFAVFGDTLVGKVWSTGDAEPPEWQIASTDADYTSGVGGVMLATYTTLGWNQVQAAFDDVSLTPLSQEEVWVDGSWSAALNTEVEPGKIFGYNAFSTIQDGIAAVDPGGTVYVAVGTYNEALTIGKALTLLGPNAGISAGVDAGVRGAEAVIVAPSALVAVFVNQANIGIVTVDGFYVSDDGAWIHGGIVQGSAARDGTTVHFLNNIVEAPATVAEKGYPIQVTGDGSTVIGNRVEATHMTHEDWSAAGILVSNASSVLVEDNLVIGHAGSDAGVAVQNTGVVPADIIVSNNEFRETNWGIYISAWLGNVGPIDITGNHLEGNTHGLRLTDFGLGNAAVLGDVSSNTFENNSHQVSHHASLAGIDLESILAENTNTFDRAVVVRAADSSIKVPTIFSNIEDAIAAAEEGDTIEVMAGTYFGYAPLLDAEIAEASISIGEDASASTTNVSADATGGSTDTTVTVAEYVGNPTSVSPGFVGGALFFDVHVGGPAPLPTELVVEFDCGGECSGMVLRWFDGTAWQDVSLVSYTNGTIVATLSDTSSPTIAQLTGTLFSLGGPLVPFTLPDYVVGWEGSPVSQVAVLAPWIALLAIMASAGLLVLRRRRAQI